MTTAKTVIHAELHRVVLDEVHMRAKREEEPGLPPRELTPELWVIFRDHRSDIEGKNHQLPAMIGLVLADARVSGYGDASVAWTLTGVPPEGSTLAQELDKLGVTLHAQWPTVWR
ncbi:hypothetical protein [Amycolatopsis sp. A1MSW2902]|uniref:hypothetical protein n=1 Tax=Amycolatopsis sp. A1MSW2902 TaxID=687413 RepID=UPI00307FCB54